MDRFLRLLVSSYLVAGFMIPSACDAQQSTALPVQPLQSWTNVVAGEEVSMDFRMPESISSGTSVGWSVLLENAVVRRSETAVRDDPHFGRVLTITFTIPEGDAKTRLTLSVIVSVNGQDRPAVQLFVYPADPFQQRISLPEADQFVVFDPSGNTADRLKSLKLSFRSERRIDTLSDLHDGILIIGEGTSFRQYRGLGNILRTAASRGVRILCLSPTMGTVLLDEHTESHSNADLNSSGLNTTPQDTDSASGRQVVVSGLRRLECRHADVLREFDRYLDVSAWRGVPSMSETSLQIAGKSGSISVDFSEQPAGWVWIDAEYAGGGRIVFTSLQMIRHWESGPGPRHAFWNCLAEIAQDSTTEVDNDVATNEGEK
jgi:hypothetical protein